jgi:hypothetical protein
MECLILSCKNGGKVCQAWAPVFDDFCSNGHQLEQKSPEASTRAWCLSLLFLLHQILQILWATAITRSHNNNEFLYNSVVKKVFQVTVILGCSLLLWF